jgi:hypothetical protein
MPRFFSAKSLSRHAATEPADCAGQPLSWTQPSLQVDGRTVLVSLPILGIWMLPLGLLLIAQDLPALQKPIVAALEWIEAKWKALKAKWEGFSRST